MVGQYNFDRFLVAQDLVYVTVLRELWAGKKYGHYSWYIFPQLVGLGQSVNAQMYALHDLQEARAYLNHPILGVRLIECLNCLLSQPEKDIEKILGTTDRLKLCSCVTLFREARPTEKIFQGILDKFYGGIPDQKTLAILAR